MIRRVRPGGVEVWREAGVQTRVWRARASDGSGEWVRANGVTHRLVSDDSAHSSTSGQGSRNDLVAQFPGRVRKILVASGETVQMDQPLLLIEAMKMEFPVKAPYNGVVRKVLLAEGDILSPGQLLVDLERSQDSV